MASFFSQLVGPVKGSKTYIVGAIMLLNMIYTAITGDSVSTYDNTAGGATGEVTIVGGMIGAGIMTIRAAVADLSKRLDAIANTFPK